MARSGLRVLAGLVFGASIWFQGSPASAGCGCDKAPPPLAPIRPAFASPGDVVTIFPPGIEVGQTYTVVFKQNRNGEKTRTKTMVQAVALRDYADGLAKPQLRVEAPDLPPGPTKVVIREDGEGRIFKVRDSDFTMLQAPVSLAETDGGVLATCYRAAVAADGTVYVPVDISDIAERMVFSGIGLGYPLLFGPDDVTIYNTQGVLMQLLGPNEAPIYEINDPGSPHSFELVYDRHEFVTYRTQHQHENGYGLDPADPAWHTDGSRHIDHDRLVVAITGLLETGDLPPGGETPPFDLHIATALASATAPASAAGTTTITWGSCN